jgi:hypothetical protein
VKAQLKWEILDLSSNPEVAISYAYWGIDVLKDTMIELNVGHDMKLKDVIA